MPTYDVPVHELVIKTTELNGCHTDRRSKPRATHYWVPETHWVRKIPTDTPMINFQTAWLRVEDRLSRACRNYYLWGQPCCAGCQEPKDLAYEADMRAIEARERAERVVRIVQLHGITAEDLL